MRTVTDDDMELSFYLKKNLTYCATLTYVSATHGIYLIPRQRHNPQRCHAWTFHSKIGYKWIEIR